MSACRADVVTRSPFSHEQRMLCLSCSTETTNPKFCGRSCAAKLNGKLHPKRKPQSACRVCAKPMGNRRTYCDDCFKTHCRVDFDNMPLSLYREQAGSRNSYQTCIRHHARKVAREHQKLDYCAASIAAGLCGYTLNVQCCHIRAVSDFPETTTLAEVNAPSNLIGLCPTHHWELDHGHLKLSH